MNDKVTNLFNNAKFWQTEMLYLRQIALSFDFDEELKWGQACYCINGKNIFIIAPFKNYFSLNFFKGALLKDTYSILERQTENTHSSRVVKFTSLANAKQYEDAIKDFFNQAINIEKEGLNVEIKQEKEYPICNELKQYFTTDKQFEAAFYKLTLGRQHAYLLYFNAAKQAKTRQDRIDKNKEKIINGLGIND
jgi:uncharacterized protein YdeI (YjbR/CyaY-like superfamily)